MVEIAGQAETPSEAELALNRMHFPVTALGPGRRLGVWLQGCSIGCPGCISRDTWDAMGAPRRTITSVIEELANLVGADRADGITISGGEPFEQPAALIALIDAARGVFGSASGFDVLIFTGLLPDRLAEFSSIVDRADVIVAGPYVQSRAIDAPLRASANQEMLLLTELAAQRYGDLDVDAPRDHVQVAVADGQIYMIGLPRSGALHGFAESMADRGVEVAGLSWTT